MAFIKIDDANRIAAASYNFHCGDGEIEIEIPAGIALENIHDYKYVNGEFVYDPVPVPDYPDDPKTDLAGRVAELEEQLVATKILLGVE